MTLEELKAIRDRVSPTLAERTAASSQSKWKIVASMGTSAILHGARDVLSKIVEEVEDMELDVFVTQSGSFGLDEIEPMCAVYQKDQKVVYGKLKPEMIRELLETHIVKGEILTSYRVAVPGDIGSEPTPAE